MAEYLVIRLGTEPQRWAEWIVVDDQGSRRGAPVTGPLTEAAAEAQERDVIVLVPAAAVLTTAVNLPMRGGSRLLAALPFALEEQLAADIETLHFAAGARRDDGKVPAAVVSLEQMSEWLALLADAGIVAAKMIPENHGLARIPGTLSMLIGEGQIMFNDGADSEFVLQGMQPREALEIAGVLGEGGKGTAATGGTPAGSRHLQVYCLDGEAERSAEDWRLLRAELASVDMHVLPDGLLPRLAVTVAAGHGVNLLQGAFATRSDALGLVRPWRFAAALLLVLGIVLVAGKAADYYRLGQHEDALREQFTAEYRQIRPDDTREIVDPVGTVSSLRRSIGGPVAKQVFLPSLEQLGTALQQNNAAKIEAISYRAGVIDVRLTAPDVATLDNIQRVVSGSGRFTASIQSTDQVGDKVSSRIQIREAGA
jgi:general secretion pathway protein L